MHAIIRPPSEAYSFILLAMLGCPHNNCTFCPSYKDRKFKLKPIKEILHEFNQHYRNEKRVFLADGDAISIPQQDLITILKHVKKHNVERISSYITARSALNKSIEQLKQLKDAGLDLVYLGIETGNNSLLKEIKKGVTRVEMIKAANKIKKAGINLSVTILLGIGGKTKSQIHAIDTASILNQIQPDYIGALTVMAVKGTEFHKDISEGKIQQLEIFDYLEELKVIIKNLEVSSIFRSNHASNYLAIGGTLPEDKEHMLSNIEEAKRSDNLRSESDRAL